MSSKSVRIGLVQMSMSGDKDMNLKKASAMTEEAVKKGAKIVILPELFAGPYFCIVPKDTKALTMAEAIPGPISDALSALAKRLKIVLIGGSIYELADGKRYNTSCLFGPDGAMLGSYRKGHIPHDPGFYEQDYFGSGNEVIKVHETPYGRIAVGICYDQWFPEFARIAALKGADLIVYPTAIGMTPDAERADPDVPEDWEQMWRAAQVGHSASNNVYVAAVNRVGDEGRTHFFGGSFVSSPLAAVLVQGDDTEQVLLADVDFSLPKKVQESWRFLAERRPDLYGDLTKNV